MLSVVFGSMAKNGCTLPWAALVMDLISLVFDWVVWASHLGALVVISAVAGTFATLLATLGLLSASSSQVRILDYLDVGLVSVALGAARSDTALVY